MLAAAARGVGSTAPLALLSGPGAIAKATMQGIGSGIGGEVGQKYLPINSSPAISALAGMAAGQGAAGAAFGAAGRGANALRGAGNPVVEAYDTAGVTPRLAGDVTGNPLLQGIQSLAMRSPFAGVATEAARKGAAEFANSIEGTAGTLGSSRTLQEAGTALQQGGKDWLTQFKKDSKGAWDKVDAAIPATTPTPLANYAQALNAVRTQMPNAPSTAATLEPSLSRDLLRSLTSDTRIPAVPPRNTGLLNASGNPIIMPGVPAQTKDLTWQDAKSIRTQIGERLAEPQLIGDTSQTALKRLYGALSDDLQGTAANQGSAAQDAFNQASALTRAGHGFIDGPLSQIIRGNEISPEQAAETALNSGGAGGTLLQTIRGQMPNAADELAAFKLRDMAAATPGKQTQASPTSATSFSTNLNSLSPEARVALFAGIEPKLSALQTVAERGKETYARYGNPSGTSGANQHANLALAPLAIGGAVREGHEFGGIPGAIAAGTAASLPFATGPAAANLTARELLTRYLASPTGGPGVGPSRLYRAAGAAGGLAPLLANPQGGSGP